MASSITTERLLIKQLNIHDNNFIFELVNTEGWIKFIGNRNITSPLDASAYIKKILDNKNIFYWVVYLKNSHKKVGIITFIKRDYLVHHDIGFAFLPQFSKQGFAYEAASAVLRALIKKQKPSHILATTIPENISSIKLLQKIGLAFEKEIEVEKEKLHVYGASIDKLKNKLIE
jgi:ribosomal-protein-alanine N-acetyltransferase